MQIRFIDYGTQLDIQVAADSSRSYGEDVYQGIFIGMEEGFVTFSIESDDLLINEQKLEPGNVLKLTFTRDSSIYAFEGKVREVSLPYKKNRVVLDATSPIEKYSRRKYERVPLSIPITVYKTDPNKKERTGLVACTGVTFDISNEGVCVMSNEKLDLRGGSDFLVEFVLKGSDLYLLSAKHTRTGNCPQFVLYAYDYAFVFDREKEGEDINRMILSLFQHVFETRY